MKRAGLIFKPFQQQKTMPPFLGSEPLSLDQNGDVFRSNINFSKEGIVISDSAAQKYFSISVQWQVPGFGFLYLPADRGGRLYRLPASGQHILNLSFELFHTRIERNRQRLHRFTEIGGKPSAELQALAALSQTLFDDAKKKIESPETCAEVSQAGLRYALYASDLIEIEMARYKIGNNGYRPDFLFGCDTRGYFQMDAALFLERFCHLFNYGTITHYLKGDFIDFEPQEGKKQFRERDKLVSELKKRSITIEGRPLFWSHAWVTPDWLKQKSFDKVLIYLEKHIKEVVGHYGDQIAVWEVVNELHDWANELQLDHTQSIELAKFACELARSINPKIKLLINNCCPYAQYVQSGKWNKIPAKYPQRTPHQFTQQLISADVDFDLIGIQVYFVKRPLAETVAYIERYQVFNKNLHLAEIGSPSRGVSLEFDQDDRDFSQEPYEWRRHWDEALQADWLEYIFTIGYSNPSIEAANWYDFVDPFAYLKSGGLLRSVNGETKTAYQRLEILKNMWRKG